MSSLKFYSLFNYSSEEDIFCYTSPKFLFHTFWSWEGFYKLLSVYLSKLHTYSLKNKLGKSATETFDMLRVINGDKTWVYGYDPETKQLPLQWKSPISPRPKKVRHVCIATKSMLIIFFDFHRVVHWNSFPGGVRCSSVVRAFGHGAMGCWIDPSWAISCSSQCSTTGVTKAIVCAILSLGWCI